MSASVDQGSKTPQVQTGTNGPASGKETVKDLDYDNYLRQHHQAASMSNPERYVQPNFYALPGFPYFGDPAWSSGGDPLSYLGYGQPNNEYMPGNPMLNPFDYSHGGLAWSSFPQAADFVWGAAASSVRKEVHVGSDSAPVYDYYASSPPHVYAAAVNGEMEMEMRALEHGLQAVGVSDEGELSQESRGGSGHVVVSDGVGGEVRGVASSGDQASAGAGGSSSATNCAAAPLPPVKKPMSWASVASQPAKSPQQLLQQQPHLRAGRHVAVVQMPTSNSGAATGDANSTWDRDEAGGADASKGGRQPSAHARQPPQLLLHQPQQAAWSVPRAARGAGQQQHASTVGNSDPSVANLDNAAAVGAATAASSNLATAPVSHPVLEKLKSTNMYNPANFDLNPKNPRFFIIKSYSEDDIHRSIKYNIWCSTDHGNKRLDAAYQERAGRGPVFLFFSVNGSGHFCGMAQMVSPVDYNSHSGVWTQDKWKGQFEVKWIYVKDVPNGQLRHIRLENNENKPVTNSRDTQEVPPEKGKQVLKIMHSYRHTTSIFDDFGHYEKKQEEDESKKRALPVGEY